MKFLQVYSKWCGGIVEAAIPWVMGQIPPLQSLDVLVQLCSAAPQCPEVTAAASAGRQRGKPVGGAAVSGGRRHAGAPAQQAGVPADSADAAFGAAEREAARGRHWQ